MKHLGPDVFQTGAPLRASFGGRFHSARGSDTRGGVFDIDAASLRAMVDPEASRRQFAVAEAAALTLGERLRARRHSLGVTQVQLAARAGLTQEMVSNLERGRHQPRFTTLEKYARGLGIPVARILIA